MKKFYIFLVLNFKAIFHLIGYIFMVLGACLVDWKNIFDPGMLLVLLILNFFISNYQWKRMKMEETMIDLYKHLTKKEEDVEDVEEPNSEN
jgi:hypothetical protein